MGSVLLMVAPLAILVVGLAIVFPSTAVQAPAIPSDLLQGLTAPRFSGAAAYGYLSALVEKYPNRVTGTTRYKQAAVWVRDRFLNLGLSSYLEEFESPITFDRVSEMSTAIPFKSLGALSRPVPGWNVVAELPGQGAGTIVVGAHLDIVPETVEGAKDDGSGVATVLELARVLKDRPLRHRFLFILFDREEKGMLGSQGFVRNHPDLHVDYMLALDEVGARADDTCLCYYPAARNGTSPPESVGLLAAAARAGGYDFMICPKAVGARFFNLNAPLPGNILIDRATESGHTDFTSFLGWAASSVGMFTWSPSSLSFSHHTRQDSLAAFTAASLEQSGRVAERYLAAADTLPVPGSDPWLAVAPLAGPWGYGYVSGSNVGAGLVVCAIAGLAALAVAFLRSRRAVRGIIAFLKSEWPLLAFVIVGPLLCGGLLAALAFLPFFVYILACAAWIVLSFVLLPLLARRLPVDAEDLLRRERRRFTGAVLFSLAIIVWIMFEGPFAVLFVAGPAIFLLLPSGFHSTAGRIISKSLAVLLAVYSFAAGFFRVFSIFNESGVPGMATVFTFCLVTVTIGAYLTTMPRMSPPAQRGIG